MILATIGMALREVRRNLMRSLLTSLGIIIGVASVIVIVTLGRSVSSKILTDIEGLGTNLLIVSPGARRRGPSTTEAPSFTMDDVRAIIREVRDASLVAPACQRSILLVVGNRNWRTNLTGTNGNYLPVRRYTLEMGETFNDAHLSSGAPVCIIGAAVRRELFGTQDPLGASIRIGTFSATVIGVTTLKGKSAFGPDPDDFIAIPLATYQRRIAGNTDISNIYVSASSTRTISQVKRQIEALMAERRRVPLGPDADFEVGDLREFTKTLSSVTGGLTVLLSAIAAVSLVVGGIGIMNIMLVSVTERTREIGIRLSIGAREHEVLLQFLLEAVVLCLIGGIIGILLGMGATYAIVRTFDLPFIFGLDVVLIAFGFSALVGILFGFLPARRASRLNPIDALRHE